eukprot:5570525-Pyramimonas_sp.AAC.1
MDFSAIRLYPHPVSMIKLSALRYAASLSVHPAAAVPCGPSFSSSVFNQRCQTSSCRSDALIKASAVDALD